MPLYQSATLTDNTTLDLGGIVWDAAAPGQRRPSLNILVDGVFDGGTLQIYAKPNPSSNPIPITGARLTAPGSLVLELPADSYHATMTDAGTDAEVTIFHRMTV